jgi:hypothetical protein
MSQNVYRANVLAKSFPFLSENFGRSIILNGQDQYYITRQVDTATTNSDSDQQTGIPQMYYCHNVMPSDQGYQSVGYISVLGSIPGVNNITGRFLLRDSNDNKAYMAVSANGLVYINKGTGWVLNSQTFTSGQPVTTAYVSGVTYIYVGTQGCFTFDLVGSTGFTSVTLTGLTASAVLGICGSYGYMIAWTNSTVVWSSTVTPTDFTPSLVTGAGGGGVQGARGAITCVVPQTLGVIVYTTANAVVGLYSGNSRYPFNFREIVNSGGVATENLVTWDANTPSHYVFSSAGVQLVGTQQTQTVFPEVTDFISGRKFEDFNDVNLIFNTTVLSGPMQKRLALVCERYLVFSYGITELTHAIVYDTVLKRYGKLRFTHVECFEYEIPSPGIVEIARQSIAFLRKDGSVSTVDFAVGSSTSNGTALFGKYEYARSRTLSLDEVSIEDVNPNATFAFNVFASINGKDLTLGSASLIESSQLYQKYGCRAIGKNVSILLQGGWSINTIELVSHVHGKR